MNFHISPLSPLRPSFSASPSPSPGAARRHSPSDPDGTYHDTVGFGQPKIEVEGVEGDDEMASTAESDSEISADDVTQDSRDVLVQRLNDLAQRLSGANVRTENIEALHAQVDAMEKVLYRRTRDRSPGRRSPARRSASLRPGAQPKSLVLSTGNGEPPHGRDALGIMAPMSPSWLKSHFQRRLSMRAEGERDEETSELHKASPIPPPVRHYHPPAEHPERITATISSEMADSIVMEAENLCAEMSTVIESLQKRREESDHLHAISMQREEAANKRLLEQEARIAELEATVAEDESELRYLKIQLRGIEARCSGYIPRGADPELDESIRSWKRDWATLREKWATRRGTSSMSGDDSGSYSNLTSPSTR